VDYSLSARWRFIHPARFGHADTVVCTNTFFYATLDDWSHVLLARHCAVGSRCEQTVLLQAGFPVAMEEQHMHVCDDWAA
jgi:hypothetical protein